MRLCVLFTFTDIFFVSLSCFVLQAERRQRSVGLGSKSLDYELTGVHTYMSAVKRMTAARWKMFEDQ